MLHEHRITVNERCVGVQWHWDKYKVKYYSSDQVGDAGIPETPHFFGSRICFECGRKAVAFWETQMTMENCIGSLLANYARNDSKEKER